MQSSTEKLGYGVRRHQNFLIFAYILHGQFKYSMDGQKDLGFVYIAKVSKASNIVLIWNEFSTEYIYTRDFENEKVEKLRRNNHDAIFLYVFIYLVSHTRSLWLQEPVI